MPYSYYTDRILCNFKENIARYSKKKTMLLYNWHLENLGTKKGLYLLDMRHLILTFVANPILILISYKKYF
jgi:hypothetical protein